VTNVDETEAPPNPEQLYGSPKVEHVCYSLFFDEHGNGPDHAPLGVEHIPEWTDRADGKPIVDRGLFLVVGRDDFGNLVSRRGGYRLLTADVRALRDKLSAWLDSHDQPAAPAPAEQLDPDGWVWGYSLDSESPTVVSDVFATREEAIADASQNEDEFETAYQRWERFRPGCPFDASQALDNPPDELHESGQDIFCDAIGANEPRLNELLEAAWDTFLAETPEAKPVIYWLTECQRHELAVTRDTAPSVDDAPPLELGDIAEPEDTRVDE
jgi:hypothetical protein